MKTHEIELAKRNGTLDRIKSRMVDEKICARYTISEQIAILRQKSEKPMEYAEFYDYAESCKAEVNEYIKNPPSEINGANVLTLSQYEAIQRQKALEKELRERNV